MKNILLLLLLLTSGLNAQTYNDDWLVAYQDIPVDGWYWDPENSGWGLNCSLTEAAFSSTGYFMFCSIFTYEEDGDNIWYTASGEYSGNSDVYAWREGRDYLSTFTSPLYLSTGGNCLTCPHRPNDTDVVGEVSIKWITPLDAELTIGSVTHSVRSQFYHAGLNANNIDFITDGMWKAVVAQNNHPNGDIFPKVLEVSFSEFDPSLFERFYTGDAGETFPYNVESKYFISTPVPNTITEQLLLIEFNQTTNQSRITLVGQGGVDENTDYFWFECGGAISAGTEWFSGYFLPTSENISRFYYDYDDESCPDTLSEAQKRRATVILSRIPEFGNDLKEIINQYYPADF